jgi:hypothetical protein
MCGKHEARARRRITRPLLIDQHSPALAYPSTYVRTYIYLRAHVCNNNVFVCLSTCIYAFVRTHIYVRVYDSGSMGDGPSSRSSFKRINLWPDEILKRLAFTPVRPTNPNACNVPTPSLTVFPKFYFLYICTSSARIPYPRARAGIYTYTRTLHCYLYIYIYIYIYNL